MHGFRKRIPYFRRQIGHVGASSCCARPITSGHHTPCSMGQPKRARQEPAPTTVICEECQQRFVKSASKL